MHIPLMLLQCQFMFLPFATNVTCNAQRISVRMPIETMKFQFGRTFDTVSAHVAHVLEFTVVEVFNVAVQRQFVGKTVGVRAYLKMFLKKVREEGRGRETN